MEFDVFVSYSSHDRAVVQTIAERLRDERVHVWFDRWALTAGRSWQDEIAAGLASSGACAVCIGPGEEGAWSREEVQAALVRAASDPSFRVFAVLLPGLGDDFELSPFVATRTWVDLRGGVRDLQPLINAVLGVAAGGGEVSADVGPNPYPGLRPFEREDAPRFFGRDAEIQRAVEALRSTRFLAVVGASGSGKSSLVRAGLLPSLPWRAVVFKPGAAPLEALAVALAKDADPRVLRERFGASVDGLHLFGRGEDEPVLLVADQFEEVFTRCRSDDERRRFIESLVYAATAPDGRLVVVLTLRADFYGRCAAHPSLSALLSGHQLLIGPMTPEALRLAILEPARLAGGEFEPGLVDLLVDEVRDRPGALPLLEHALFELWERRSGRMLTLAAHRETGGVGGAVAHRAEEVYTALDLDARAIARRVLLRLIEPGEGTEDTRRRAALAELPGDESFVRDVVSALADARLLTTDDGVVDVAHEALIRGWPRLRTWIDEDREGLRIHRRITETSTEWDRLDHDPGLLFRGARLAEAIAWRTHNDPDLNDRERAFLDASAVEADDELQRARDLAETRRRASRRLVAAVVVLVAGILAAGAATVVAFSQRDNAQREQRAARAQSRTALARQLAAQSREQAGQDIESALLTSLAAVRLHPAPDTQAALAAALSSEPRLIGLMRGSGATPLTLVTAPDGRSIVSVGTDGAVTRWDLARRRPVEPPLHVGPIRSAAVSADLSTLVEADKDGRVHVWDLKTRRAPQSSIGPFTGAVRLQLDQAATHLVVTDGEGVSTVWAVGSPLRRLSWLHPEPDGAVALSPDGTRIAINEGARTAIRDLRSRRVQTVLPESVEFDLEFMPNGREFVGSDVDRQILRDEHGRAVRALPSLERPLAISADASRFAGLDDGGGIDVYSRAGKTVMGSIHGFPGAAVAAAFAGTDQLVTASVNGALAVWRLDKLPLLGRIRPLPYDASNTFTADNRFSTDARKRSLQLYAVSTGRPVRELPFARDVSFASNTVVTRDARLAAAVGTRADLSHSVLVWDSRSPGSPGPTELTLPGSDAESVTFALGGQVLVVAGADGRVGVWKLDRDLAPRPALNVPPLPRVQPPPEFGEVWLGPPSAGSSVLLRTRGRFDRIDVRTGRRQLLLRGEVVAVSGDQRTVATREDRAHVAVRHLDDGRSTTVAIADGVDAPVLSPHADLLAYRPQIDKVIVEHVADRVRIAELETPEDEGMALGWSGDHLAALTDLGLVTWDLSLDALRRRACGVLNRQIAHGEWNRLVGTGEPYQRVC